MTTPTDKELRATDLITRLKELRLHKQSKCPVCDGTSMVCECCGYGSRLRAGIPCTGDAKMILCMSCAPDAQFATPALLQAQGETG